MNYKLLYRLFFFILLISCQNPNKNTVGIPLPVQTSKNLKVNYYDSLNSFFDTTITSDCNFESGETMTDNMFFKGKIISSQAFNKTIGKDLKKKMHTGQHYYAICKLKSSENYDYFVIRAPGNIWESKITLYIFNFKDSLFTKECVLSNYFGDEGFQYNRASQISILENSWKISTTDRFFKDNILTRDTTFNFIDTDISEIFR